MKIIFTDIPVLLIVVDKGKMGITYPKSLVLYDLKLRYTNPGNITQTALEQDIGRVCRYKDEDLDKYPLPTVFISSACKDAIMSIVKPRAVQEKVDITLVPPANPEKMLLVYLISN